MSRPGFEPTLERAIGCSARAPAEARRAIAELEREMSAELLRDVQLVVSELVTNSVRHSGSEEPIQLRAWWRSGGLKVEVADGGAGFEPGPRTAAGNEEGGRGLLILESVADRWGIVRDAHTCVWFEVADGSLNGQQAQAG